MMLKRNVLCDVLDLVAVLHVLPLSEHSQQLELINQVIKDYPFDNKQLKSNHHTTKALEFLKTKQIEQFSNFIELALSHLV